MRIVITGGTGLVGRELVKECIQRQHDVTILSRKPGQRDEMRQKSERIVLWDGMTSEGWSEWVDDCNVVINLAGENVAGSSLLSLRWTKERKQSILESRIKAGQAVCQAIKTAFVKPKVVIQASAVGFYGSDTGDRIITEDSPTGFGFLADVCREWEASTSDVEGLGVRRIVLRLGVVLSAHGGALPRQVFPYRFFAGGKMGCGNQWMSWIHISDVVKAILFLIEQNEAAGIYNFCAPEPVRNAAFSHSLGKALNRPAWITAPGFVVRTLFGEAASILLEGQRVVPTRLLSAGYAYQFPALDGALNNLLQSHP